LIKIRQSSKHNPSSDLFTSPTLAAHEKMVSMGAKIITVDPPQSPNGNADTSLRIPDIDIFFDTNAATALSQLSKTKGHVTRQIFLAHWLQTNNILLKHVQSAIQADDSLQARLTIHLNVKSMDHMTDLISQRKRVQNFVQLHS
jgi:hypothetical protein